MLRENLLKQLKTNFLDKLIPIMLIMSLIVVLSRFIEIGLTGDDPFIYMDAFRRDGILKASIRQAIGQGRFWLVLTWTLSQLTYIFNNLLITNVIKIIINLILFFSFFYFIKQLFNRSFAYLVSFIGLMIFNIVGGEFNPLFNSPLWYALGGIFILCSFIRFKSELSQRKNHFYSYTLFFIGLLYYEIFIFYVFAFPIIYLMNVNHKALFSTISIHKLVKKFFPLAIVIIIYLCIYGIFRHFYPSGYPNNQKLVITSLYRTYQTIMGLSKHGIAIFDLHRWEKINYEYILSSLTMTIFLSLGLFFSLKKLISDGSLKVLKKKCTPRLYAALIFFTFCPNFFYGFIDYYHSFGYYVGTFFSALAIIVLVAFLLINLISSPSKIKGGSVILLLSLFFYTSVMNYHHFFYTFNSKMRVYFYKHVLMDKISIKIKDVIEENDKICSPSMRGEKQDAYEIYNFWSLYLSQKTQKKISVTYDDKDCDAVLDFVFTSDNYILKFRHLKNNINLEESQKRLL